MVDVRRSKAGCNIVGNGSWCGEAGGIRIVNGDPEFLLNSQDEFDTIKAHDMTPKTRRLFADRSSIAVFSFVRMPMA